MRMKPTLQGIRISMAVLCAFVLVPGTPDLYAQPMSRDASPQAQQAPKIPSDQLDSLVAPIALYPDPLLAQVLAASTYPIEIIQLQQWLEQHKDLKDKALADAVQKQDWDPSVQGLAGLPDVVKRLTDDIKWTTDLGNAFLAQQSDVMDAVQRMRAKAQGQGNLKSNEQVKVETKVVESKQVIVVQQANPQVVYVPSYNPVVVYGPPVYPYPPIYYPPPSYYAGGMAISFGVGVAMGAMWSGGWGYNCGWHGSGSYNNNVTINNNNNFIQNNNATNINSRSSQMPANRGNTWQHNSQHRGGTPYSNQATADRFGGTTRGSSQAARENSARQNVSREQASGREFGGPRSDGAGGRQQAGTADRAGAGSGRQQAGTADRAGAGSGRQQAGTADRAGAGSGKQQAGSMDRGRAGGGAGGGGDHVGNRSVPPSQGAGGSKGSGGNALGGSGGSSTGSGARASSSRGTSSMGGGGGGRPK